MRVRCGVRCGVVRLPMRESDALTVSGGEADGVMPPERSSLRLRRRRLRARRDARELQLLSRGGGGGDGDVAAGAQEGFEGNEVVARREALRVVELVVEVVGVLE